LARRLELRPINTHKQPLRTSLLVLPLLAAAGGMMTSVKVFDHMKCIKLVDDDNVMMTG
jgi:hypothetical protein